jgi:hypothetical protein
METRTAPPPTPPHHLSPLCEMERTYYSHLPTTPTAGTGFLHRSPYHMGSYTCNPPNRGHTKHPLGLSGPPWCPRQDFHSYPNRGGNPSQASTPAGTHVPIPSPGTHLGRMEIQGHDRILHCHHASKGHCPFTQGLTRAPVRSNLSGRRSGYLTGHQITYPRTCEHAPRYTRRGNGHGRGHVPSQGDTSTIQRHPFTPPLA